MIEVRPAGRADLQALIAIDPIMLTDTERRQSIAHWMAAGQCFVAVLDDKLVGYVALTKGFFHQPFVELLIVAEDSRRSGIGVALTNHCIALIPAGAKLWTSTNSSNLPMQGLLLKLGFVRSGIVENMDEGDPELIFVRLPKA